MAHISLDRFLGEEEKSLADLDWLDINPAEYTNLPFDPTPAYISVPKLEQAWSHEKDHSSFNLVPNSDMNFNYKTIASQDDNTGDVKKLIDYTKIQMMTGKKGNELKSIIHAKATNNIIKAAFDHLKKLSNEQGLLGYVYIDPTVFAKCEDGAEFVRKRAKTAKYVVSMDKCGGCAFNREGRCEVYKKHLASEVSYNQDLFDFYSRHFANVTGQEVKIASRVDLKNAFTFEEKETVRIAKDKPSVKEIEEEEKTLNNKEEEYKQSLQDLKDALTNVNSSKVAKDIAWLLVKGYSSDIVKDHLSTKYSAEEIESNKEVIKTVLAKQGSLGRVYIDTNLLPLSLCDKKVAKEFFDKHARKVHYIVANCECTSCGCKTSAKKVVKSLNDIPKEAWDSSFESYSTEIKAKVASTYNLNRTEGLKLAFLEEGLAKSNIKSSTSVESYELTKNIDTAEYTVKAQKEVFFTPKKISAALQKGFTLSKIMKTGRSLGVVESDIKSNIVTALESHVESVNKYQIDIAVNVPSHVRVKMSGKDIALDLDKPITEVHLAYDSSAAPSDNLVHDMDLRFSSLDSSMSESKKYEEINISGLDQYTIG